MKSLFVKMLFWAAYQFDCLLWLRIPWKIGNQICCFFLQSHLSDWLDVISMTSIWMVLYNVWIEIKRPPSVRNKLTFFGFQALNYKGLKISDFLIIWKDRQQNFQPSKVFDENRLIFSENLSLSLASLIICNLI